MSPLPAGGERAVSPSREHSKRRRSRSEGEGVLPEESHPGDTPHPRPAGLPYLLNGDRPSPRPRGEGNPRLAFQRNVLREEQERTGQSNTNDTHTQEGHTMLRTLLDRLLTTLPALAGVVVVSFLLTRVLPGDTAAYFAGPAATPQAIAQIRTELGLDRPLPEQFARYVADLARGDLGRSLTTGQPVTTDLGSRLPASAELTLFGLVLSLLVAIPLGVAAALKQGSLVDHACRVVATAGVSLPVFFTGLLLVYAFYFVLGWAPAPLGRLDAFASPPPTRTASSSSTASRPAMPRPSGRRSARSPCRA